MTQRDKLILLGVGLLCLAFLAISIFVNSGNQFYSGAYSPMVEKSAAHRKEVEEYKKQHGDSSDEPRAPGFREREIEKNRGEGYSTY